MPAAIATVLPAQIRENPLRLAVVRGDVVTVLWWAQAMSRAATELVAARTFIGQRDAAGLAADAAFIKVRNNLSEALGKVVATTGAAEWVSSHTIAAWSSSGPTAVGIVSGLSIALTELVSNSAVVAMMMPVTIGVAQDFAMEPRVMALVVAVPAGLAFALPIGTPANAIAYSSGYITMRDMLVPGGILAGLSWVTVNLVARVYWPLLGISLGG